MWFNMVVVCSYQLNGYKIDVKKSFHLYGNDGLNWKWYNLWIIKICCNQRTQSNDRFEKKISSIQIVFLKKTNKFIKYEENVDLHKMYNVQKNVRILNSVLTIHVDITSSTSILQLPVILSRSKWKRKLDIKKLYPIKRQNYKFQII